MQKKPTTCSIRVTWPFARLAGRAPDGLPSLRDYGIDPLEYVNPTTRIPHRKAIDLLLDSVLRSADPAFGVHAAELIEPGDFDALEYAARTCATVRDAWHCVARYGHFLAEAVDITIVEVGDTAEFRYRVTDDVEQPPAANDFFLISVALMAQRDTGRQIIDEVRFAHPSTAYLEEYARVLRTRVTFNAKVNTLVIAKDALDIPLRQANPRVSAAFERQIQQIVDRLEKNPSVASNVRRLALAQLGQGELGMGSIARKLSMSPATLRRRLAQEGVRYADIVDELRRELGEHHLLQSQRTIDDIAFILGYADAVSFHKAWKRWTGKTPNEYRAQGTPS